MSNMETTILAAMANKKCLSLIYDGLHRIVEPHTYGIYRRTGDILLRAYQVAGDSNFNEDTPWRVFILGKMAKVQIVDLATQAPREGYKSGNRGISKICCIA